MSTFIECLKNNSLDSLKNYPKTDLHNHGLYSSNIEYLNSNGLNLSDNSSVVNFETFYQYIKENFSTIESDKKNIEILLKGTFDNCIKTGVTFVSTGIDYKRCIRLFDSNINDFIEFLNNFKYDNLKIQWILEISRDSYKVEHKEFIKELLKTGFFGGLDLASTENIIPNVEFKEFYELANSMNLLTKVHAGEQLDSDYVKQCILDFNPKQIQHGISIINDLEVVELAKKKDNF